MAHPNSVQILSLCEVDREKFNTIEEFYNTYLTLSRWKTGTLEKFVNNSSSTPIGFIALSGNNVVGFVFGKRVSIDSQTYTLCALLVHPDFRNIGISSLLLNKFLSATKGVAGISKINLHFRANNRLERYYSRFGFSLIESNEKYTNGEKKIQMERVV